MRIVFLALALMLTLFAVPVLAQNAVFVSDIGFAPYSMVTQGKPSGIDVDVIREAAKRAGLSIDIQFKPFEQMIAMVKDGSCDGAFTLFRTPERERIARFMDAVPVHLSDYVLFTKVGNTFTFNSYNDLSGKIIGRVAGIALGKEFATALDKNIMEIKEYPDLASALRGLIKGDIDAYAGNIDVTYYRLKAMGMTSSIVYLPKKLVEGKPAYLVMSRASKYPEKELVLQKLGQALARMHKDGTYNRIVRNYLIRY